MNEGNLIALHGLTHVRTSLYYQQSNGKVERFHGTIKKERIRKKALLDQDYAKIIIGSYIAFYNNQRLHSVYLARLSDHGDDDFCVNALKSALHRYKTPAEIY